MFYQFDDDVAAADVSELKDNLLTVGYVSIKELAELQKHFNLPLQAVEMCRESQNDFDVSIESFDECFFIRLAILGDDMKKSSRVGLFILSNLLLVVNINDVNFANRDLFMKMMSRVHNDNASAERLLTTIFECLVVIDDKRLDNIRKNIAELEEAVIRDNADDKFNIRLLKMKREIFSYRGYYERLIDVSQVLLENENELFDSSINSLNTFCDKAKRLKDSVDILADSALHLWDAYQTSFDIKLNQIMKIFTLVSTIFFPLTVIVGWYGMNFKYMPELDWKYGYIYVILLSIAVVGALIFWFKKKGWL